VSGKRGSLFGRSAAALVCTRGGIFLTKKKIIIPAIICAVIIVALIVGIILTDQLYVNDEGISETMKDAVLHEKGKISFFGMEVNPAVISAFSVTAIILVAALAIRIFALPRFKRVPGKFQLIIETAVGFFYGMAKKDAPYKYKFLGAYIFAAGAYIFIGTLFELFGLQAVTVNGTSITLPAPLSDINAAIAMGGLSYLIILYGGVSARGPKGLGRTLKEFSLPVSMSFRIFGAMLSGLLVTELVYYYISLSFVLPVVVGVVFTVLHAVIQTYILVMLTSMFYGEVSR